MTALEPPTTVSEETPGQLCHIQCPLYLFNIFYHLGHWSSYQALDFSDLTSKENGTLWIDLDSNSVSHSFAAINRLNKNSIFARFHFINSRCINITSSIQHQARPFLNWQNSHTPKRRSFCWIGNSLLTTIYYLFCSCTFWKLPIWTSNTQVFKFWCNRNKIILTCHLIIPTIIDVTISYASDRHIT